MNQYKCIILILSLCILALLLYFSWVLIGCICLTDLQLPVPASWLWRVWLGETQDSVFWYLTGHLSLGPTLSGAALRSKEESYRDYKISSSSIKIKIRSESYFLQCSKDCTNIKIFYYLMCTAGELLIIKLKWNNEGTIYSTSF